MTRNLQLGNEITTKECNGRILTNNYYKDTDHNRLYTK